MLPGGLYSTSFTWWFIQLQFYLVVCTAPVLPSGLYSSSFTWWFVDSGYMYSHSFDYGDGHAWMKSTTDAVLNHPPGAQLHSPSGTDGGLLLMESVC